MIFFSYKILASLPLNARIFLGRILGSIYGLIPGRESKIAALQMKICLKSDFRQSMIPAVFANAGQTATECLNLNHYLNDIDTYVQCDNWDLTESLKKSGRSIVVLTAHTGNWDLLAAYAIKKGFAVSTIARQARNPDLQQILVNIRQSYGIHTIWKDSPSATKEIIQALRSESVLAALIDQDLEGQGLHAPFFGMPAKYPSTLITLAKKSKSHIIAAFNFREKNGKYKIYLHKIDSECDVNQILAIYSNLLEKYIKLYPDQWVWFHKRWRSLENGTRLSTREYTEYLKNYEHQKHEKAA